jgi:imidazolonepropionase-like amidohydrolase
MKRLLLLLCLLVAANADASAQVTAIKAGRLVDPATGSARANQVILVEGSRIKAVGGAELAIMCFMVDRRGPERGSLYFHDLVYTSAYRALEGAANARQMLESGFTTIRDVGNAANYADTDLRRAIERGLVPGPTIVNAGRIIAPFGGQYFLQPERRELGAPEYFAADTRDEMRKAIRENIHFGAKVIKIVVDDQQYIYSADDIRFIVEEARAAGVKVAAHCLTEAGGCWWGPTSRKRRGSRTRCPRSRRRVCTRRWSTACGEPTGSA